ncbi:MAG TPA: malto-oligosyltrehalose synthase [Thermomicrobiales bacterium]|nr:malto-oligosyltrehalose synthase [Thermomicrobiales bacterium]
MNPRPVSDAQLRDLVDGIVQERRSLPAPRATYRLQFNHTFTFADATALVPYFADLGISHVYASPIFKAAPGSMHGYDVVDYSQINPEIGTREEFDRFVSELHQHAIGLILDFVPNHMGIEKGANAWWQDVLENGRMSRYADCFDIDWTPLKRELQGKVLLPFLGGQYGEVLERGELVLAYDEGGFLLRYYETPFPIDPSTWPVILRRTQTAIEGLLAPDDLDVLELESITTALENLPVPGPEDADIATVEQRSREQLVTRHRLDELTQRCEVIRDGISGVVDEMSGIAGDPRSFDALDALLARQNYRLAFWRVAAEEINYRRFFAINTLAAIRQEEPVVFQSTHDLLISLLAEGAVDGVRFDHPDGLWDPEGYFHDVQAAYLREMVRRRLALESGEVWQGYRERLDPIVDETLGAILYSDRRWPVYVIAEKILEHGESLPGRWAIAGTVGYEFAREATGVLVNADARKAFDTIYYRYTGDKIRFPELVYEMKQSMMRDAFPSEVNVLTNVLNRISERDRHSRDFTLNNLRAALREVIACFGVYRTYTTCDETGVTESDRRTIEAAVDQARRRNPQMDASVFDFVQGVLLLHVTDNPRERFDQRCHFAMKVQQLTGPVMAKGLEDTAFYRFNRLVSLNEVGGDPATFGSSVPEFHRQNRNRRRDWPHEMLASSTHDTKRSEDVRARISVLSENPVSWRAALNRWTRLNRKLKTKIEGTLAPSRVDEYVIYQTLFGTWPLARSGPGDFARDAGWDEAYIARIQEYMLKVAREAGRFTNWVNPANAYEEALKGFIGGMLNPRRSAAFLADFQAFVDARIDPGLMNALAQQVLKLTSPGVPDIYQGTEVWDDSLVDPDNRRSVDFAARQSALAALGETDIKEFVASRTDGRLKLDVTRRLLSLRREHRLLFEEGDYVPLAVEGPAAEHVIAFLRRNGDEVLLVAVPRLLTALAGNRDILDPSIWDGTMLLNVPEGSWRDALTGDEASGDPGSLSERFATMPVCVLILGKEA